MTAIFVLAVLAILGAIVFIQSKPPQSPEQLSAPELASEDASSSKNSSVAVNEDQLSSHRCSVDMTAPMREQAERVVKALDATVMDVDTTTSLRVLLGIDEGDGEQVVASALYVAALEAGLSIVERHAARTTVAWASAGLDAAVGADVGDLVISNTTPHPVRIHAIVDAHGVEVTVLGTRDDEIVREMSSQVIDSLSFVAKDVFDHPEAQGYAPDDPVNYVVAESRLVTRRGYSVIENQLITVDTYRVAKEL